MLASVTPVRNVLLMSHLDPTAVNEIGNEYATWQNKGFLPWCGDCTLLPCADHQLPRNLRIGSLLSEEQVGSCASCCLWPGIITPGICHVTLDTQSAQHAYTGGTVWHQLDVPASLSHSNILIHVTLLNVKRR